MNHNQDGISNPNWKGGKSGYVCDRCGDKFYRYASEMNRKNRPKNKNIYCSRKCRAKGYYIDGDGYIYVSAKNHPNRNNIGYVRLHRLIVEKHIGRYLDKNEIVHHKDENKTNNHINNLEITTFSEHSKNHAIRWKRDEKGRFKKEFLKDRETSSESSCISG